MLKRFDQWGEHPSCDLLWSAGQSNIPGDGSALEGVLFVQFLGVGQPIQPGLQ